MNRFLFPEQYERNLRSRRRRRTSIYPGNSRRDAEEEAMRGMRDILKKTKARASKSKSAELTVDDFKEVQYLQKFLKKDRDTIPEKIASLSEFVLDEEKFPPIEFGSLEYQEYDPPPIGLNHPYMDKFSQYYDLFSAATKSSDSNGPSALDYTLQTAMHFQSQLSKSTSLSSSSSAPTATSTLTMDVIRSSLTAATTTTTNSLSLSSSSSSLPSSDVFDVNLDTHPASLRFLQTNMKTYKQTQRGLPNALGVSDKFFVFGMSKSQVICYPRPRVSFLDQLGGETPLTPMGGDDDDGSGSGSSGSGDKPFTIGTHQSAEELGSVLSLSIDVSGQYIACGYSTGSVEILSIEKQASMKSLILHDTAVLFVRYLGNGNLLTVDYDGNVSITVFTRKMFALSATTTKVIDGRANGQVEDLSVMQFSVAVRRGSSGGNGGEDEGDGGSERRGVMSVDLIALTTKESTMILTMDGVVATVLFTLPRVAFTPTKESEHYDERSKSVQRVTCSAWRRGENNSFEFVRCDDELVEVWRIDVGSGSNDE